ncbi:MAG: undecaprenyldiphospho-muramoylpentapeptide beta-N-acetylglucosaminyltransferase [Parafannyhessea umbonata]|uniref:UDP-N-acetylglucosamine--N-acetylmuramyl-(pentapeptide) pyrophosphoryl-undecaprenol N-acetylglucosamine transferase n=1 Tax=Parafannyhessea umbonata TaxID=604330 RepID=A0A6N7X645_9ACTN|nr:undecaprenyldiphospho-muramoylpentapeptide beta-N-acetylglucosaminyltransferase [Parafannyhessea umbonata]MCI7219205.1 undecaprenyldiphospho-muramoylpentapeptide beta-N-acetylglucosaminyltransferase [Parafannyhessea umbonata]MDD6359853.1 undecaprenyldiphospho-muramoylpentapeptide beta-N-acetylglucosaminyltransferase [Parafannyhessea umbonata]MST59986.1 undecaprenyldiphospho-muramoylpentapeptide beta-N-acetylglucosaminyltransferase [Parafannyhessea umbonata]
MADSLRVAIAAGGTAGHINPALALAEELAARGHQVEFFGQPKKLESTLVPQAGFPFNPIDVTGFDRSRPWTLVSALWRMRAAQKTIGRHFGSSRPDVAVGFGAYIELPLINWCHAQGIPCVIHEQNSVPGLANKTSAAKVKTVCVSLPVAIDAFRGKVGPDTQIVVTGNPVRQSVIRADRAEGRRSLGIPKDATMLLVFGGSLGARHLNEGVAALKSKLLSRKDLYVIHSTGKGEYDSVVQELALTPDEAARWRVMPYIDRMGEALAAADLVLSRAGASSVAEIAALAVPSMLVPYPFATADHQTTNARYLVDAGAAVLLPDEKIDTSEFEDDLLGLVDDPARRQAMRDAARGLAQDKAALALADQVESAAALKA